AYRVIVGQFATLPAATAALRTVQANGQTGIITDIER
ncbi:MAG: hypothetical protein HKN13_09075, partial [Rhodothermales bacterium]|nr:hypothetical protein [Rhodothermales bacterium]